MLEPPAGEGQGQGSSPVLRVELLGTGGESRNWGHGAWELWGWKPEPNSFP